MTERSWVSGADESRFPVENLPYGIFARLGEIRRVGVAIGEWVLDLGALSMYGVAGRPEWFVTSTLNPFLAAGRPAWTQVREQLRKLLTDESHRATLERHLVPMSDAVLHLPIAVGDYVDFYSSLEHATNMGRLLRSGEDPLLPNWRHLPVAYHGRAGTVVVSGTPVRRPCGQRKSPSDTAPTYGPSQRLDLEAEVGFVVGKQSTLGEPVSISDFREFVFGVVLVNDWSARDIQAWEYQPLGPFLSKSFATSISPWVVTLDALESARIEPPAQDPHPLPYLRCDEKWGLDIGLQVALNGQVISRPPFAGMYWTAPQQLAHLTVNGASVRPGDLLASGTVSGPKREECGSLMELTANGTKPLELPGGGRRAYLEDGDTVTVSASAPGPGRARIGFGEVSGRVDPAR